jgi:hypothetical protein
MILLDQSGAAAKESKLFSPSRSLAPFEHFWVQQTLSGPMMQHVGLSPRRLLRIERLHRVLANSQGGSVS